MSAYCVPSLSPGFSTYSSSTSHSKACLLGFVFVTVAPTVRRLPAMPETQARPLGREDPLEKETVWTSRGHPRGPSATQEAGGLAAGSAPASESSAGCRPGRFQHCSMDSSVASSRPTSAQTQAGSAPQREGARPPAKETESEEPKPRHPALSNSCVQWKQNCLPAT